MDRWTCYEDAPALAEELLGAKSVRFQHVTGVAAAAVRASVAVPDDDVDLLVAAAWLHDIGYAESVADTGFHPLDGARYLRRLGAPGPGVSASRPPHRLTSGSRRTAAYAIS